MTERGIFGYELKFNPNLLRKKNPSNEKSNKYTNERNNLLISPTRRKRERMIIVSKNLSPKIYPSNKITITGNRKIIF